MNNKIIIFIILLFFSINTVNASVISGNFDSNLNNWTDLEGAYAACTTFTWSNAKLLFTSVCYGQRYMYQEFVSDGDFFKLDVHYPNAPGGFLQLYDINLSMMLIGYYFLQEGTNTFNLSSVGITNHIIGIYLEGCCITGTIEYDNIISYGITPTPTPKLNPNLGNDNGFLYYFYWFLIIFTIFYFISFRDRS